MDSDLPIHWSGNYHPEWDLTPEAYLMAGIVLPSRSRRLGRYEDVSYERKGYIGVYHQGTSPGQARFFLSLFVQRNTLGLWSFATMPDLLVRLTAFHHQDG
jgi:hypothetical protein